MTLRAAFFDVGDTLVEHWAPSEVLLAKIRERVCAHYGEEPPWLDDAINAGIEPPGVRGAENRWPYEMRLARQETNAWYEAWFRANGIDVDGIDIDRLRSLFCVPLDEVSVPAAGAFDAVRWCKGRGLRVVLVSNTLSRGDEEVLEDWRRFGLDDAIDGVVSSHSVGWRKPNPAIFERALAIARARPDEAFHVGDSLIADVWGAKQIGLRAVWRKRLDVEPPAGVDVEPDATIRELTELPGVVTPWLAAGERVA